jgi:hypothetical protein
MNRTIARWLCLLAAWSTWGAALSLLTTWGAIAMLESRGGSGLGQYFNRSRLMISADQASTGWMSVRVADETWFVLGVRDIRGRIHQVRAERVRAFPIGQVPRMLDPSALPEWNTVLGALDHSQDGDRVVEQASGWPFLAWQGRCAVSSASFRVDCSTCFRDSTATGGPVWDRMVLFPYGPIVPGIVLNSCFFGGVSWLTYFLGRRFWYGVRARFRKAAGRCVLCGYDARALPVCPECGSPMASHR